MDNKYYILEDGEQTGPYTFDELTEMELNIHTRVLSPLTGIWEDACDLPELYPYFESQGIYLPTGDNLASFGWRLLAYIIDYVVLSFLIEYVFILLASQGINVQLQAISNIDALMKLSPDEMKGLQVIVLVVLAVNVIYNSICEASPMRGSFGKRLCKLVVVDIDGVRLSYLNALLRSIGKALSIFFGYLGFISILFTEHKQAVHDLIAKTYVVKRD